MIRICVYTFILASLLIACKKEQPLSITAQNFTEKELSICDTGCPEITVNYIQIEGDGERANNINSRVKEFIIDALYLGEETSSPSATSIAEAGTQFVKAYQTHTAEFPDMELEYFVEINIRETYNSPQLLSLEMHQYLFTGGAHGYGATFFENFDAQTGQPLTIDELFKDKKSLVKLVEKEFRKAFEIQENESINATGFWFEDDRFHLPESIGFSGSNLVMIYNQYDIASYAAGPIELEIPLKKVESYLSFSIQ